MIENDGRPVKMELARGTDGDKRGAANGSCELAMFGKWYLNKGEGDGRRNGMVFEGCEVDPEVCTGGSWGWGGGGGMGRDEGVDEKCPLPPYKG